ncbi:MAG: hypothetical protein FIB07_17175 [Candidatus Methanoperedens sp.]|nr:hypothetical protein [Candidatus Methanoperedens sp.]
MSHLHTISAEMHTGMLVLAFISISLKIIGDKLGKFPKATRVLEQTAFVSALAGLLFLIVSAITGLTSTWPGEALFASPLVLNKILFTGFAIIFWTIFLLIRWKYGVDLWKSLKLKSLYVSMALGGFLSITLTGSMGGHIAGKESLLDLVLHKSGINTHVPFTLPETWIVPILVFILSILIVSMLLRKKYKITSEGALYDSNIH